MPVVMKAGFFARKGILMHIVHVHIEVKEEYLEQFIAATVDNASHSVQEEGVARFDVIQQADDPTRFVLVEVYRTLEDNAKHRETAHFARWRDSVEKMMVAPRTRIIYKDIFPDEKGWK